jgi:hypothetical protein
LFFVTGCHAPKKITTSTAENIKITEKQNQTSINETYDFIDTTKKSGIEINYFKVEFYPPDTVNPIPETVFSQGNPNVKPQGNPKVKPTQGAIKSIEGYTIKNTEENAGISSTAENNTVTTEAEINANIQTEEEIIEQPAPDPYRWRYIFYILITLVIVAGYFWLKKTKIFSAIFSAIKGIF